MASAASRMDPAKVAEAQASLAEGEKKLSTSLMKWKPDYAAAEPCFKKAGQLFRVAGMVDSAVAAWRRAADCSLKTQNVKQAVVTLDTAARELLAGGSAAPTANKVQASAFLAEAAGLLYEAGEPPRAADLKLRAGKLLEGYDNDRAARLYDEAAAFFDGDHVRARCAAAARARRRIEEAQGGPANSRALCLAAPLSPLPPPFRARRRRTCTPRTR